MFIFIHTSQKLINFGKKLATLISSPFINQNDYILYSEKDGVKFIDYDSFNIKLLRMSLSEETIIVLGCFLLDRKIKAEPDLSIYLNETSDETLEIILKPSQENEIITSFKFEPGKNLDNMVKELYINNRNYFSPVYQDRSRL